MKRVLQILALIGLFLLSFLLFLFLTFPYEVLKEQIAAEISQASGFNVRIGKLGPDLPLGLEAGDVKVTSANGLSSMQVKTLSVEIGILSVLLGKLHVDLGATAGAGSLDAGLDFPLLGLLSGEALPSRITLESTAFPLDPFIDFGLSAIANAPGGNPMVAPLLGAIGVSAQLNAKASFDLDSKNPTQSKGELEIQLAKAVLKLSHPSLGLPDQDLKKALIKAKVDNGTFVLDKSSGIVSDELQLSPEGKITLKPQASASQLDMKIVFKLDRGLKEKFGFLIDAVSGNATSDGQLTMQVRGPLAGPAVTTF
jgi:hypothetical protein